MSFLTEEDYKVQVRDYELDDITGYSEAVRLQSELAAQEEMESYLRDRFDVATIFAETGNDRSRLIVLYMVDIALYHLFSAITPRQVPQIRMDRYDMAIRWLNAVAKGTINPGLPENENADGNVDAKGVWGNSPLETENW